MAFPIREAFGTDNPADLASRFEAFKGALNASAEKSARGGFTPEMPGLQNMTPAPTAGAQLSSLLDDSVINKAISADTIAALRDQLAAAGELNKDLTLTAPLSTGYVAYDLEGPAKMLTPKPTPLRNRIPRGKGVGTAHRYKRITGFTGTGTGGVGNIRPGITDATQTDFKATGGSNSLYYARGPKISYAGDEATVPYQQFSLSDQVPWSAQFAGQGFQDIRQLSQSSLLYASMLMEERMILGGRGTAVGYAGALAAPGTPTVTTRAAATGETGNTANIASFVVGVSAVSLWGETAVVFSVANTNMSAATGLVADVRLAADVPGAIGYKVYIGTVAAFGSVFQATLTYQVAGPLVKSYPVGQFPANLATIGVATSTVDGAVATINFVGGGTGGLPTTLPAIGAGTDSSALDYDGILTQVLNPAISGYIRRLNSRLSTSNVGDEYNTAFAAMYDAVKADPDLVMFNGNDRKQLSDIIKQNSSSASYRIMLSEDQAHNATVGAMVTGIQNEVTGKMVDMMVHPWLPQGVTPILSFELPIPDTEVSDCWKIFNVQDFMSVQWPVMQFAYEASTYWYGTMLCYAAAWQGCIAGINRV